MRINEARLADMTETATAAAALLRLAGRAPSDYNVQPWRFVVVQDADTRAKLSKAAFEQQQIVRAPATIVLVSDMENALQRMPDSMHPGMSEDQRAAGVENIRGTFAKQSLEGMPRFFRRLREGVFDLPDLHRRTGELGDFLEAAAARYGFGSTQLYAVGFSNGANIAASLMLTRPGSLAGGVLLRAMVPFVPETAPDLSGLAVLLCQGRTDTMIPASAAERLAAILRSAGADVELTWQPGGHAMTQTDVRMARRWLDERVPATEDSPVTGE